MSLQVNRAAQVRIGVWVEIFTVLWMIVEAAVSIAAGVLAGSALLTAFGIDSIIELVSGAILLWRLRVEARGGETERVERAEHRAAWVVAILLALLCLYVLVTSIYGLMTRSRPEGSLTGIVIAAAAVVLMPLLGVTKRRLSAHLGSRALRGDAASSLTCGYKEVAGKGSGQWFQTPRSIGRCGDGLVMHEQRRSSPGAPAAAAGLPAAPRFRPGLARTWSRARSWYQLYPDLLNKPGQQPFAPP